ncbi:hypothetical protein MMC07_003920 [Pseudocyphellaria aurata]|nr:hypothetical protein [Pseudocyphellaria aurata]
MATQNQGWLWNPYETLDLDSLGTYYGQFFCVGFSDTYAGKPGCGWSIDRTEQLKARQKLDAMAVKQPQSPAVTAMLRELVHFLLCTKHHQHSRKQRDVRFSDWLDRIQKVTLDRAAATETEREGELTLQVQQLKAKVRGYQEQERLWQEDLDGLKRGAEDSAALAANLRSELKQIRDHLQNEKSGLESQITGLKRDLYAGKTDLRQAQKTVKAKNEALASATAEKDEQRSQLAIKGNALEKAQRQLDESERKLVEYQSSASSETRDLNSKLGKANTQISRMSNVNHKRETELQDAQRETTGLKVDLDAIQIALQEAGETIKAKDENLTSAATEKSALQLELEATKFTLKVKETQRQLNETQIVLIAALVNAKAQALTSTTVESSPGAQLRNVQAKLREKEGFFPTTQSSAAAEMSVRQFELGTIRSSLGETGRQLNESKQSVEEQDDNTQILQLSDVNHTRQTELQDAKRDTAELKADLNARKPALQEALENIKGTYDALQRYQSSEMSAIRHDLNTISSSLDEARRQLDESKQNLKEHQSSASSETHDLNKKLVDAKTQISRLSGENSRLETKLQHAQRVTAGLEVDLDAKKIALQEAREKVEANDNALQGHQSSAAAEKSALQLELEATKFTFEETQRQLNETQIGLIAALVSAKAQASTSTTVKSNLRAQLQNVQTKLTEMLISQSSAHTAMTAIQLELKTTKSSLEDTQRKLNKSEKSLKEQQSSASSKSLDLETSLEDAMTQISLSSEVNNKLETDLQHAQREASCLKAEVDAMRTALLEVENTYNQKLATFNQKSIRFANLVLYVTRRSRAWHHDSAAA